MTDKKTDQKEETVIETTPTQASPGSQLRKAREAMGLTQQQVADRLHLRLNNVEDIESDTHQKTVSITFTKGYVRIYAKLLGIDAEPLLAQFDSLHSDEKTPAKLQSFSQRVAQEAHDERWMMVTYLVVFLVVASVVIWWFQQSDKSIGTRFDEFSSGVVEQVKNLGGEAEGEGEAETEGDSSDASNKKSSPEASQPRLIEPKSSNQQDLSFTEAAPEITAEPLEEEVDNQFENNLAPLEENAQTSSQTLETEVVQTVNEAQETISDAADDLFTEAESAIPDEPALAQEPVIAPAEVIISEEGYEINPDGTVDVVFTFKDDCWVSVRDVNKETMAYGVKKKGRIMSVSGIPPIRVILGAPQNVEIDFGGQAVDMTVHPAGRSANFKLPVVGE